MDQILGNLAGNAIIGLLLFFFLNRSNAKKIADAIDGVVAKNDSNPLAKKVEDFSVSILEALLEDHKNRIAATSVAPSVVTSVTPTAPVAPLPVTPTPISMITDATSPV